MTKTIEASVFTFTLKTKTNDKLLAKQYFEVVKSKEYPTTITIRKLFLEPDIKEKYTGYNLLKTFKNKRLFEDEFAIKLSTLEELIYILKQYKYI